MLTQTINSKDVRYRVRRTNSTALPPITLAADTGSVTLQDYLTPEEAAALGSALCAAALAVDSTNDGTVTAAMDKVIEAADRFDRVDAATGQVRR